MGLTDIVKIASYNIAYLKLPVEKRVEIINLVLGKTSRKLHASEKDITDALEETLKSYNL